MDTKPYKKCIRCEGFVEVYRLPVQEAYKPHVFARCVNCGDIVDDLILLRRFSPDLIPT